MDDARLDRAAGGRDDAQRVWRRRAAIAVVVALVLFWILGAWIYETRVHGEIRWGRMWFPAFGAGSMGLVAYSITRKTVGFQLLARAILLAQVTTPLQLGVSFFGPHSILIGGATLALVLLGADRLAPDGGPFAPVRFRRLLIVAIVVYGALSHGWLSPLVEVLPEFVATPRIRATFWEIQIVRAGAGLAFVVAAVGLYRLRTIALLVPVMIGAYFVVRGLAGPVSYHAEEHGVTGVVSDEIAWGFVRTGAIISFSIAPIVLALVYARLRSHRLERGKLIK